ncbi:hypothetical protein FBUS_07278 [Fasciolopsis buskii]|uniref:Uncharacterized protein n=1 Tax=Fasciolopsis buskii TaxID=27845 RepID=A0A8E0RYJ0_9TREM|nr:hypothetical protein FBUS_07278 [Fasciolopsis buski]
MSVNVCRPILIRHSSLIQHILFILIGCRPDSLGLHQPLVIVPLPRSQSEQVHSVQCESKLSQADQLAVLFDVVQEQSDWESTRLCQASSVHSTHSESDTFTLVSHAHRLPARKYSAPSITTKSIPEVPDYLHCVMSTTSPVTSLRSQSSQSVSEYHRCLGPDSLSLQMRDSPLKTDSLRSFHPHPKKYDGSLLQCYDDPFYDYEVERHVSTEARGKIPDIFLQ